YISGDPNIPDTSEYNIQINFVGTWTAGLRQAFISAADAISDFILGDVAAAGTRRSPIDDLVITASLVHIDGPGLILGQAGPTAVRFGSLLPYKGTMQFDIDDANYYAGLGLFDDIVLHEMLHTVGFGTIWTYKGLIADAGTIAPTFNGPLANAVYPGTDPIPLETGFGEGTDESHWDEDAFTNELMTGFIDNDNTLSYMTIASLGDLGYSVVSGASYLPPSFI
ncbi:MAG: leishmanolysin-related zinc metalloendopeptidase, partial [bacterium]